ncbi:hypothetical protein D3C86_2008540 [compost metagenome]
MAGILQAIQPGLAEVHGAVVFVHDLAGLQLLAAQADHQGFATQVGVARQVAHRANRDIGIAGGDGHATAVAVGQGHDIVDVGVLG